MRKKMLLRKTKVIAYSVIMLLILASLRINLVNADTSTQIAVVPESIEVGDENVVFNKTNPTEPFVINITVTNVTNLFCWQVRVWFNLSVMNCSGAWYPSDHVFAGELFIKVEPMITPTPVHPITKEPTGPPKPYVQFGASLLSTEHTFNGSGILCQMEFIGWGGGLSVLNITNVDTVIFDHTGLNEIPYEGINGAVTVKSKSPGPGPGTGNFTINSLSITPAEVAPNEEVQISVNVTNTGDIEDTYNVTLKINDEIEDFKPVTLTPNASTTVTFNVTRGEEGTYNVEVDGETGVFTVEAEGEASPINWWLIAGIILLVIIIGGAVILYKRRKTQF